MEQTSIGRAGRRLAWAATWVGVAAVAACGEPGPVSRQTARQCGQLSITLFHLRARLQDLLLSDPDLVSARSRAAFSSPASRTATRRWSASSSDSSAAAAQSLPCR